MSVKDVIKQSVLTQFGSSAEMSSKTIVILLISSVLIGSYLFVLYKNQSKTAFYSKDINITIAGLPVIVCAIMIAMQSNLIVSLGMVGALSIVRFRNAVKNPLDLLYFFWSISAGIICGVGLVALAVILCAVMTGMILILGIIPNTRATSLIVLYSSKDDVNWSSIQELLKRHGRCVKEKSRNITSGQTEIIYELIAKDEEQLISELKANDMIERISYLSHDGELRV